MKKKIYWLLAISFLLLVSCKPKQVIVEKVITRVDSSAVMVLRVELESRNKEVKDFKVEVRRLREENVRLESESSSHTITYDTNAPLKPDGQYPKASETISGSKSKLDKVVKAFEESKAEYRRVIESLEKKNENINLQVDLLKKENSELKAKITPTTGFNLKLWLWCFVGGLIVGCGVYWRFGSWFMKLMSLKWLRK